MTLTDADLVARALGGSQRACRELVCRYQRSVFNLIVRMIRDRALAEDLTQETFLKAFSRLRSYKPEYKFSNWLLKIAHNTVIDHVRVRRVATVSFEAAEVQAAAPAAIEGTAANPLERLERAELARHLEAALAGLRPEYRQAIVLRYHEELGHEDISQIMGVPVGTVKSHLHRARAELAVLLRSRLAPEVLAGFDSGLQPGDGGTRRDEEKVR